VRVGVLVCMLGLVLVAHAAEVRAAVYTYLDEGGVINLTNLRPENRQYRVVVEDPGTPEGIAVNSTSSSGHYDELIHWHARSLDIDPHLVKAVMLVESNGNPRALSKKGAQGLMQIMPSTGRALALQNPFDPGQNIAAGARYLKQLHDRFMGNLDLVLAAYNAGPERVVEHNLSVPPIGETIRYVKKVKDYYALLGGQ